MQDATISVSGWRVGTANGFLLACYLIPAWAVAALKLMAVPLHGLFDPANVASAIFVSDHLQLMPADTLRFAMLLGIVKMTVVAFFATFAAFAIGSVVTRHDDGDELLIIGLVLAGIVSVASMVLASQVGEFGALRLHATESLMILGAAIVLIVEGRPRKVSDDMRAYRSHSDSADGAQGWAA